MPHVIDILGEDPVVWGCDIESFPRDHHRTYLSVPQRGSKHANTGVKYDDILWRYIFVHNPRSMEKHHGSSQRYNWLHSFVKGIVFSPVEKHKSKAARFTETHLAGYTV